MCVACTTNDTLLISRLMSSRLQKMVDDKHKQPVIATNSCEFEVRVQYCRRMKLPLLIL